MSRQLLEQWKSNRHLLKKSSAYRGALVSPKSGELRPSGNAAGVTKVKKRRPDRLALRLSDRHKKILKAKARAAGVTTNQFILAAALGSSYRPSQNSELIQTLLLLSRELTAQGNDLNQIARYLHINPLATHRADSMLGLLGRSLLQTHRAVRLALTGGEPAP